MESVLCYLPILTLVTQFFMAFSLFARKLLLLPLIVIHCNRFAEKGIERLQ